MHVFGTHNARFCAGFMREDPSPELLTAVVPLGPAILEWDVLRKRRRTLVTGLESFVVHLSQLNVPHHGRLVLVCTYHGLVSLWRMDGSGGDWHRVSNELNLGFDIEHARVHSHRPRLAVFGEALDDSGRVAVVDVKTVSENQLELVQTDSRMGRFGYGYFGGPFGDNLALFEQRPHEIWLHAPINEDDNDPGPDGQTTVYFADGELDVFVTNETQTLGVAACRNRRIIAIDLRTHRIVWTTKVPGHGIFKTVQIKGSWLVCPTDSGQLYMYNVSTLIPIPLSVRLQQEEETEAADVAAAPPMFNITGPTGIIHSIDWVLRPVQLDMIVFNDYGLYHVVIPLPVATGVFTSKVSIAFHELTCCGVDLRHTDNVIVAGDFTGQLLFWQAHAHEPMQRIQMETPIRCVRFLPSGQRILMGTVSGEVWSATLDQGNMEPWTQMGDTITCVDWCRATDEFNIVATASTNGSVMLMSFTLNESPVQGQRHQWLAHSPIVGPQDLRFGSIGKFAEVWSLVWAPRLEFDHGPLMLATGSEDQSVKIWQVDPQNGLLGDPTLIMTLRGHSAAVTCVSWSSTPSAGSLLISVSDDRTVRAYDATSWSILCVLTSEGYGLQWHTLTYCALASDATNDHQQTAIVASSSNGYLLVWSKSATEMSWALKSVRKLHAGSIEGLAAHPHQSVVASCSSDCSVHLTAV